MSRVVALVALVGACLVHACTLDFDQYRDEGSVGGSVAATGGGGATAAGGNPGTGGVGGDIGTGGAGGDTATGGAGGAGLLDLGTMCGSDEECDIGECCKDGACKGTCMVPCDDAGDCPIADMGCEHGYCLFTCSVDADCEQPDFVCHHGCTVCEKKSSQGCM